MSKWKIGEGNKVVFLKVDSNKVKINVIVDINKYFRGIG